MNTTYATTCCLTILLVCLWIRDAAATLRGPKSNNEIQVEDYIIMQMEMAWGMKEMSRYKSHRGEWPTRSAFNYGGEDIIAEDTQQQQPTQSTETKNSQEEEEVQQQLPEDQRLRGNQSSESEQNKEEDAASPLLGEIDDEMAILLEAKKAARTVEEYWDTLVAMF